MVLARPHAQAEYARAVREVVKEVLRSHTVPRLAAEAERHLWLHFVAEAVAFERKLAEVRRTVTTRACRRHTA